MSVIHSYFLQRKRRPRPVDARRRMPRKTLDFHPSYWFIMGDPHHARTSYCYIG
jgi:hypothetical protein